MQSRQDYIIAVKEKRGDTDNEGDDPGGAGCGKACEDLWAYMERRFELATCCQRVQCFEELRGKAFWFGRVTGDVVMVTLIYVSYWLTPL